MLARIGLKSLGRFVTSMHKSFPAASATILRRQATPGTDDGRAVNLAAQGKDVSGVPVLPNDPFTPWWSTISQSLANDRSDQYKIGCRMCQRPPRSTCDRSRHPRAPPLSGSPHGTDVLKPFFLLQPWKAQAAVTVHDRTFTSIEMRFSKYFPARDPDSLCLDASRMSTPCGTASRQVFAPS